MGCCDALGEPDAVGVNVACWDTLGETEELGVVVDVAIGENVEVDVGAGPTWQ